METRIKQIREQNRLTVEVSTNGISPEMKGLCDESKNYNGFTETSLKLTNETGTFWNVFVNGENLNFELDRLKSVELVFNGNSELQTLITALEFAVKSLKEMKGIRGVDEYY